MATEDEHLLTLKVMRLSKPTFNINTSLNNTEKLDSNISDILLLPSSFGNMYLGENFLAYLCINNDSKTGVRDVAFKAELQTSSQRFPLHDTTADPNPNLLPSQTIEYVVCHEIKELGVHILVCSVHYTTNNERRSFRKFYKFQILNPFAVKTKVNNTSNGRIFLEAQIQNMASHPLFIERVHFDPNDLFSCRELNTLIAHPDDDEKNKPLNELIKSGASTFALSPFLNKMDMRQYLYLLTPKQAELAKARNATSLGRLDISWRTSLGDSGRLQTNALTRKPPVVEALDLSIISIPSLIHLEQPFTLRLKYHNPTKIQTHILVSAQKSKMNSVLLMGSNSIDLGIIKSEEYVEFEMRFYPLMFGCCRIEGVKILDVLSGNMREIEVLAEIFVERN